MPQLFPREPYMDPHYPYTPPPGWETFGTDEHERYLGEICYCDSEIGRFLAELDALKRTKDTLVVFIADHGEAFMEHGFTDHGHTVHREEVHVPLILRWPGHVPAGRRVRSRVRLIDAHTTIAELMGLSVPRHVEGESLTPLFGHSEVEGNRTPGPTDRTAFSELFSHIHGSGRPQVALYVDNHKLMLWLDSSRRRLYDVRRDPKEQAHLAAEQPALAASMERRIRRFLKAREGSCVPARPVTPAEKKRLRALGYLDPGTQQ